jgi:hypothetical protein
MTVSHHVVDAHHVPARGDLPRVSGSRLAVVVEQQARDRQRLDAGVVRIDPAELDQVKRVDLEVCS